MWVIIRLLLILECLLGLVSKQGGVTCAHMHLPEGEDVFLHIPCGFTQYGKKGGAKVLNRIQGKYMLEKKALRSRDTVPVPT